MALKYLDGATGTFLWDIADRNGTEKYVSWKYNMEHPDYVEEVAKSYVDAGSDIIYTNTFTANRLDIKRQSDYAVADVVAAGVKIARKVADEANAGGKDVQVALSIGPLSELMEPYGDLEEDEVYEIYDEIVKPGIEAGADLIIFETFIDLESLKVAVSVGKQYGKPVFASMAFEAMGKTIFGVSPETMIEELTELGVDALGMNCGITPAEGVPIIKKFAENTDLPLIFKTNAGKPVLNADGSVSTPYTAEDFARDAAPAKEIVSYIGGCCGTSPEFIRELRK